MARPADDEQARIATTLVDEGEGFASTHVAEVTGSPRTNTASGVRGELVDSSAGPSSLGAVEAAPPVVAGRYELLGMLGGGAMGTVYRVRDRELDEIIALKILRRELAHHPEMLERFRREVKLARRVTHRNVARTFDIGEHGGDRFLTMELIRGEALGDLVARRGRLSIPEVLAIGYDVCSGLSAAHSAGVLHRDLKPDNVVLTEDGRAVITDFGIARASADIDTNRTGTGIVGTPAYMAPEQVEGKADIDARADLYAFGIMLYELLSGQMPWGGDTVIAVATARLTRPPPDLRHVASDVPDDLAEIVLRLMATKRDDRFANADDAGRALDALAEIVRGASSRRSARLPGIAADQCIDAGAKTARTVAVLPIVNRGAADDEYIAQTVGEDLLDLLSVVPNLRVLPRGHTMRFVDPTRDVRTIGRELGVDVVVDASLRRVGDVLRFTFRLVTVEDGFQLWAHRFDGPVTAVLSVSDQASSAIARALTTERTAEDRRGTSDAIAQELYLRGRYLLHRGWFETSREAVGLLRDAYERAPSDARIGGTYALAIARSIARAPDPKAAERTARQVAEKALAIDAAQPEARVALGILHLGAAEATTAVRELQRALSVAPNLVDGLDALGRLLIEVGRTEHGIAMLERALAIDPDVSHARHAMARVAALLGDRDGFERTMGPLPAHPGDVAAHTLTRGRVLLWYGDVEGTRALAAEIPSLPLPSYARYLVDGLLRISSSKTLAPADAASLAEALPLDPRLPARQLSFNAQLRTELKTASGDRQGALDDLRFADGEGLLDRLWLDRCPLLVDLCGYPDFLHVRANVERRAARVAERFDEGV